MSFASTLNASCADSRCNNPSAVNHFLADAETIARFQGANVNQVDWRPE